MIILYSLLMIAVCVLIIGWKRRKSKSGKPGIKINLFIVAGIIILVFIVLFFVFMRIGMDHSK